MRLRTIAGLLMLGVSLAGCRTTRVAREPEMTALTPLFGPIVSSEVIGGRQDDRDNVWLLVGGTSLVHIDLAVRTARRVAIPLAQGEQCWSLARLQDGSLWTLKGRNTLIELGSGGAIGRSMTLGEPHVGLFGAGERLIFQAAQFTSGSPALKAGAPREAGAVPWSAMTTRAFERLPRGAALALNIVACGGSATEERPCWFPDEGAVSLIDPHGATRRLALPGLAVVPPDVLVTAENPARPVRDAYVDRNGRIWVISSGTPPNGESDRPGGWLLARYSRAGAPDGIARLREPVRLILRVEGDRAIVLSGSGHVSEVRPW